VSTHRYIVTSSYPVATTRHSFANLSEQRAHFTVQSLCSSERKIGHLLCVSAYSHGLLFRWLKALDGQFGLYGRVEPSSRVTVPQSSPKMRVCMENIAESRPVFHLCEKKANCRYAPACFHLSLSKHDIKNEKSIDIHLAHYVEQRTMTGRRAFYLRTTSLLLPV
jgi:hypothetical protein